MSTGRQYLLDTNVLSEMRKRGRNERIIRFTQSLDPASAYVGVLSVGELRKGIELKRRQDPLASQQIDKFVTELELAYAGRILPVDIEIARLRGLLLADRGRPVVDTLIAATAMIHDLTLVTRNTADAEGLQVPVINPWEVTL